MTKAQVSDAEYVKLLERDKNVPQEKIDKAFVEAQKIQDDILATIVKNKKDFKLLRTSAIHLKYDNPGQRGGTYNEVTWQKSRTRIFINFRLGFKAKEEVDSFRSGLEGISQGDFFEVPKIGDDAILVKNVLFNTRSTNVGLHFVKGRAKVSIYVTNFGKKTKENEKVLMEFVKLIEPLIIARSNFDD